MPLHPVATVSLQLFAAGGWLVGVLLIWPHSKVAAVSLFSVGAVVIALGLKRKPVPPLAPEEAEGAARLLVTKMLGALTRVQVAYLCQNFDSDQEGRDWLRRTLPRSYKPMLADLQGDLEAARRGKRPKAVELAQRVLALRPEIEGAERALKRALEAHPDHVVASPVIFVVTANIDVDGNDGEQQAEPDIPLVVSLASLDPTQATLVAAVDTLALFVEKDGKREIRGQTSFDRARRELGLRRVKGIGGDVRVYRHEPVEGQSEAVAVERPPLGFIIGASELV